MKKVLFCILFMSISSAMAEEITKGITNYGDLYLLDQSADVAGPHRLAFGGGFDTANSLRDIANIQLHYSCRMMDFLELGLLFKKFFSDATALKERIDQEFDLIGLQVEGQKPQWASYFTIGFIPLAGRVNFFSKKMLPFEVGVSVGPGARSIEVKGRLWGWFWSLQNRLYLSSNSSLELNFTQEMEAAFESNEEKTTRHQMNLIWAYTF